MWSSSKRCYCAFCRSPRRVYSKKHISFIDICLAFAAASLLSFLIWQDFDPRLVVIFALGLGFSEVFVILRWRLSIACPHCGFDPVLYKKNAAKAAEKVKAHMDDRRAQPLAAFGSIPKLPVRIVSAKDSAKDSSKAVAKSSEAEVAKAMKSRNVARSSSMAP